MVFPSSAITSITINRMELRHLVDFRFNIFQHLSTHRVYLFSKVNRPWSCVPASWDSFRASLWAVRTSICHRQVEWINDVVSFALGCGVNFYRLVWDITHLVAVDTEGIHISFCLPKHDDVKWDDCQTCLQVLHKACNGTDISYVHDFLKQLLLLLLLLPLPSSLSLPDHRTHHHNAIISSIHYPDPP